MQMFQPADTLCHRRIVASILESTHPFEDVAPGPIGIVRVPPASQVHLCSLWRDVLRSGQAMKVDYPANEEARR